MTAYRQKVSRHSPCGACAASGSRMNTSEPRSSEEDKSEKRRNNGSKSSPKRRGFIGRYLDRLAKVNEREFGSRGPCCH